MSEKPIAITVGDPAGIGPEIAIRVACRLRTPLVVIGDAARLEAAAIRLGRSPRHWTPGLALEGCVGIVDAGSVPDEIVDVHAPTPEGGAFQLDVLDRGISLALANDVAALVTGPTSKEAISSAGTAFSGQTEHLARSAGLAEDAVTMMFLGPRLRVALVTTHLSVVEAARALTPARVERTIRHLAEALSRLGVATPRLVVCGLNPHAGEGGLFGREETTSIAPGIPSLPGITVEGPIPAESGLRYAVEGKYDGAVTMIHDQATIASKLVDWGKAVNVSWGLPFLRTSVDHGVAYDAARENTAEEDGLLSAVELAYRVLGRDFC